ncbi:MAG: LytTR family DNA-binding domain-containing protein [Bacteroidota bacterium]
MNTIKVLLVDDEYLALRLLENFIKEVPDLEIVGKEKSPIKAVDLLSSQTVDLLFLDVQMPTLSGVNLLRTLKHPPVTIFTTAYSDHAVEAFNLDAVDYLLKPFSFERFLQAVNKAKEQLRRQQTAPAPSAPPTPAFITVKSDARTIKLPLQDLLFIEGLKEYVKIVCRNEKIVTLESLKNLEAALPHPHFLRVHKSYIINSREVKSIEGNRLEIGDHKIPVSRERRAEVVRLIFG